MRFPRGSFGRMPRLDPVWRPKRGPSNREITSTLNIKSENASVRLCFARSVSPPSGTVLEIVKRPLAFFPSCTEATARASSKARENDSSPGNLKVIAAWHLALRLSLKRTLRISEIYRTLSVAFDDYALLRMPKKQRAENTYDTLKIPRRGS